MKKNKKEKEALKKKNNHLNDKLVQMLKRKVTTNKYWISFLEKGVPQIRKVYFCLSLGMTFVGFVCVKIWGSFPPNFKGPILNFNQVLQLISSDTHYAYELLNFAIYTFIVGTGMLIISAGYFLSRIEQEKRDKIHHFLLYTFITLALLIILVQTLTSKVMFSSAHGLLWFLFVLWISISYLFGIGILLLKRLYLWLQNEDGTTNMGKMTMVWTVIATVIGWKWSN